MEILNLNEELLSFGWVITRIKPPALTATFILKATFKLRPNESPLAWPEGPELLSGDLHREDDPTKSLWYPSDLAPFKPRGDLLLVGTAHAAGRTLSRLEVGFRVGTRSKKLVVFGERSWVQHLLRSESLSEAEYLTRVPIAYELAFGGPGSARNPIGRGRQRNRAPNIEDPAHPVRSRQQDLDPAGFGPIARDWEPRKSLVGTYKGKWAKKRWPSFPEDFDWGFFNSAPADQQLESYLRGDEVLELDNLHPAYRIYRSRLPSLRARCFLDERNDKDDLVFREIPLSLDTLWIDMDAEKLVLVWRGTTEVRSRRLKEIERALVLAEPLSDAPPPAEHYRKLREEHLAKEGEEFEAAFADMDASAEDEAFEKEMTETEKEFADLEQTFAVLEEEPARMAAHWRSVLTDAGIDPLGVVEESGTSLKDMKAALAAAAANLESERPPETLHLLDSEAQFRQIEASIAEMEQAETEAADLDREEEPPWNRGSVEAAAARRASFAEANLSGIDLSQLDLSELDFTGADLAKAKLSGVNLVRAKLTNADLSCADLTGADLTEATLGGADLSGARVENAGFARTSLSEANLSGLDLKGADFTDCSGTGTDFSGCDLTASRFANARLPHADFSGANLENADFRGAAVESADFEGVRASSISMEQADLTGLRASSQSVFAKGNFRKTKANGSLWEEAILDGADFSRAALVRAQFGEASLREALFDRADLSAAVFDDAYLEKAVLTSANLLRVSFERANLTDADLEGSNLYESSFWEAILERTNLRGANVKRTSLE